MDAPSTSVPADTVALVTGAGSGIGRSVARRLASDDVRVAVAGRDAGRLRDTCDATPGALAIETDLTEPDQPKRVVEQVIGHFGQLDVLVNNAGAFVPSPLADVTHDTFDHVFDINVVAPTLLAQAALEHLTARAGAIVNISSTYGHRAIAGSSLYAASKAALEHLTRCWALELASAGVRVNAVAPGPTETPLLRRLGLPDSAIDTITERERRAIPLGRRGEPDDIAAWVAVLCSPAAAWVTGQVIGVDGGFDLAG